MSGLEDMVKAMESLIGLGEPNYVQDWYDSKFGDLGYNWPWCNAAITYAAWKSGNQNAVCFGGGFAYTVAHAEAFRKRGQWHVDVAGIQRGDIVFMDWERSNNISAIDHVEFVTGVSGGVVQTIGGNYENRCDRWTRTADVIAGYGRPNYTGAPSTPPAPPPSTDSRPWVYVGQLRHAASWDPPAEQGHRSYCWPQVLLVEKALNREGLLSSGLVDGSWGTSTIKAYAAWQRRCGFTGSAADGYPGLNSLQRLGDKYGFRVGN